MNVQEVIQRLRALSHRLRDSRAPTETVRELTTLADALEAAMAEKNAEVASLREDAECANDWEQQLLGCDKELTEANAELMRLNVKIETVHEKCEKALGAPHWAGYRNAILAIAETLRVKEEK